MLTARRVAPGGSWSQAPLDTVTLDYDARFRRRVKLTGDGGTVVLLALAEAVALADGDGLVLDDGRIVAVRAASERLVDIRCTDSHHLTRVAWHLGNRHLPTEIHDAFLRIRDDHVIVDMVKKLGASVEPVFAPFSPEGGAYGHGRTHGHDHGTGHHDHHHHHDHHDHAAEVQHHD